jgi:hypothetical protein
MRSGELILPPSEIVYLQQRDNIDLHRLLARCSAWVVWVKDDKADIVDRAAVGAGDFGAKGLVVRASAAQSTDFAETNDTILPSMMRVLGYETLT